MEECTIQSGDFGVEFEIEVVDCGGVPISLALATSLAIVFKSPTGRTLRRVAALSTDGSDGLMKYITVEGDITEHGDWEIQGVVEFTGKRHRTMKDKFTIGESN